MVYPNTRLLPERPPTALVRDVASLRQVGHDLCRSWAPMLAAIGFPAPRICYRETLIRPSTRRGNELSHASAVAEFALLPAGGQAMLRFSTQFLQQIVCPKTRNGQVENTSSADELTFMTRFAELTAPLLTRLLDAAGNVQVQFTRIRTLPPEHPCEETQGDIAIHVFQVGRALFADGSIALVYPLDVAALSESAPPCQRVDDIAHLATERLSSRS